MNIMWFKCVYKHALFRNLLFRGDHDDPEDLILIILSFSGKSYTFIYLQQPETSIISSIAVILIGIRSIVNLTV